MKSVRYAALLLVLLMAAPGVVFGAKKWEKIKSPELRAINVPQVQRSSMPNGIELFVLEDHELPLFRMTMVIKGGSAYNPKDKLGLAEITAEVLRSGGSKEYPGDTLDEILESSGGSVEVGVDERETTISVNMLVEDTDKALRIVRDLLANPAYPEDKLELALTQTRSAIARRNDDPGSIADREFEKVLYGAGHPLAQQMEYEHLDAISRNDLVSFHKKYFHPTQCSVALWGDFDAKQIVSAFEGVFGTWEQKAITYPAIPETPEVKASVNLVVKESVTQSNIRLGHRSIVAKDPNYYSLVVMNEILGGGLGSRLFNHVRSEKGLAYRVGSGLGAELVDPGHFTVVCGTKSETTVQAIRACLEQVQRMKTEPVTDDELKRAKDGLLNSHVFRFANKGAIVNRQMSYVRNGYPADFMEQFPANIQKVTKEDVQRAAAGFLQPENMALVVVGKPDDFKPPLDEFAAEKALEIAMIDIAIPEPKGAEYPDATPETLAKGEQVLEKAAKAAGGTALASVSDLTEQAEMKLSMMGQSFPAKMTRYMKYPGNMRLEIAVMGQEMVQVYNHTTGKGFMTGPMGKKDYDDTEVQDAKNNIDLDLVNFLRNYKTYKPQYLEDAQVEGAACAVVLMTPPNGDDKFKIYVDQKSNYVVKSEHPGKNFQGAPVHQEEYYGDFKKVGGVVLPHTQKVFQNGELFIEMKSTSISTTDEIPADKFAKGD